MEYETMVYIGGSILLLAYGAWSDSKNKEYNKKENDEVEMEGNFNPPNFDIKSLDERTKE